MQTKIFNTKYFYYDGRGPILGNWLYTQDLRLPGPRRKTDKTPGLICGADYGIGWVIFYEMQVIQIVPEEVHSYWHRAYFDDKGKEETGIWFIEDSEWLKSFHPRHLNGYKHFILTFYDDLVEVICKDLIFGKKKFDIQKIIKKDVHFSYQYFYRAGIYEEKGISRKAIEKCLDLDVELLDSSFNLVSSKSSLKKAIKDYESYIKMNPNGQYKDLSSNLILWIKKILNHKFNK